MPELSDDQLLSVLGDVLVDPPAAAPSMAELVALRATVAEAERASSRARLGRWRRRVAVVVAGGMVLSGGTAYATSGAAPRPVRSAAFALKLPVEAPDVTDARKALADLDEELREGRRDKVAKALADAEEELGELSVDARASLEPGASTSLAAARAFLADPAVEARVDDDAPVEAEVDEHRSGRDDGSGSDSDRSGSGSGSSGSGSGSGSVERDSSGSGSSGSGSSGSDSGSSSGGGSGDSDSGSGGSGSGTSGSGSSGSDSGSSRSGSSGSDRDGGGSDDSGSSGSGSSGSGSGS